MKGWEQLTFSQDIWPTDFWPNDAVSVKAKAGCFLKKNVSNVKHKIKTVISGEEFDDDEHDETGDDHATDLMSR